MNKAWVFIALVVLETVIYGAANVVMKVAFTDISPLWCAALRFGGAFLVFMTIFGRDAVSGLRRAGLRSWLPSSICMAASFIGSSLSVNLTSATNAGFFVALPMLFAPAFAFIWMRRSYRLSTVALQVFVLAGLYLLCCNGGSLSIGAGELVGLASSAFFAAALVLAEGNLGSEVDAKALSVAQTGATFIMAIACAAAFEPVPSFGEVSLGGWAAIAFLALFGTCVAFFLQNTALAHLPSATVSVVLCGEPVFTALISAVVLGEQLSAMGWAGAAIIVGCTVAASLADEGRLPRPRLAFMHRDGRRAFRRDAELEGAR